MKLASTPLRTEFKNVLAASDLSPDSKAALAWAQRIAQRYGSKLVITHVYLAGGNRLGASGILGLEHADDRRGG